MENILVPQIKTAPYFDQYVGIWAIREQEAFALADMAKGLDLTIHLESEQARAAAAAGDVGMAYAVHDGVAVLELRGTLMKQVSSFANGTSTVLARRAIRAAVKDPDVNAIMLVIDSPGGTVAGTKDLGDEVAAAAKIKPIHAYIEDLGASAAYWIASQATTVSAGPTSLVGSIGTFTVVQDWSAAAAKEGIKVHVVRAGEFKGTGVPGTEVTQAQLAEVQRTVNALNSFFLVAVESGRKMSREKVAELADGRVHVASEAMKMGLVDAVQTFDAAMQSMYENKPKRNSGARATDASGDLLSIEETNMSEAQVSGPKAATIAEIKAECVGASADFVLAQAVVGATLEQAKSAWMKQLAEQNAKFQAEAEKARAELEKAKSTVPTVPQKPGVAAIADVGETVVGGGSAREVWLAKVNAEKAKGLSPMQACSKVNRENPGLREQMIREDNAAA